MDLSQAKPFEAAALARAALADASFRWMKNEEVLAVLTHAAELGMNLQSSLAQRPTSGSVLMFSKKAHRRFRKDGHHWKKKKDGKTVREDHEQLKIHGKCALTCCYAHGSGHEETSSSFHRRIYWRLEGGRDSQDIVLVHYLDTEHHSRSPKQCADRSRTAGLKRNRAGRWPNDVKQPRVIPRTMSLQQVSEDPVCIDHASFGGPPPSDDSALVPPPSPLHDLPDLDFMSPFEDGTHRNCPFLGENIGIRSHQEVLQHSFEGGCPFGTNGRLANVSLSHHGCGASSGNSVMLEAPKFAPNHAQSQKTCGLAADSCSQNPRHLLEINGIGVNNFRTNMPIALNVNAKRRGSPGSSSSSDSSCDRSTEDTVCDFGQRKPSTAEHTVSPWAAGHATYLCTM